MAFNFGSLFTGIISMFEKHAAAAPDTPSGQAAGNAATGLRGIVDQVATAVAPVLDTIADEFVDKLPLGNVIDPMADQLVVALFNQILDKLPGGTAAAVVASVAARPAPSAPVSMQPIPDPVS